MGASWIASSGLKLTFCGKALLLAPKELAKVGFSPAQNRYMSSVIDRQLYRDCDFEVSWV